MTDVQQLAAAIAAIAAGVAGLLYLLRLARRGVMWVWETMRRMRRLTDGFLGDPDEDRPGVLDRLDTMEGTQARIVAELHPNGGASLRDAVTRVETKVNTMDLRLSAVETAVKAGRG